MNQKKPFNKILIFGAGLIGGSFSLALKEAKMVNEIVAFGRTEATLQEAQKLGIIDKIGVDLEAELKDADLVLIATPVAQMGDIFKRIYPHLNAKTIVTDGGSTKCDVVLVARKELKEKIGQFVPAHPIAGAENSGASAAKADLYQGKKVVIAAFPENEPEAVQTVKKAWEFCGASICQLTPEMHDQVFAAVSHLPHLLSFALVHELAMRENAALFFDFAASGFRDFTRIAASHPEMWRDICLANRKALLQELDAYRARLDELHNALQSADSEALEEVFSIARKARRNWADKKED